MIDVPSLNVMKLAGSWMSLLMVADCQAFPKLPAEVKQEEVIAEDDVIEEVIGEDEVTVIGFVAQC